MKTKTLSKRDREILLQQIQEQMEQGPKSLEEIQGTVTDKSGTVYNLGGKKSGVFVDENNIPRNLTEIRGMTLDCGHIVPGFVEGLQKCDFGHIICSKHQLYRCHKCKKLLCDIEVEWEDGKPVCPDHGSPLAFVVIVIIILAIVIYLIAR